MDYLTIEWFLAGDLSLFLYSSSFILREPPLPHRSLTARTGSRWGRAASGLCAPP